MPAPAQWYAIVDTATGQLVSTGTVLAERYPDQLAVLPLSGPPDFGGHAWDEKLRRFLPILGAEGAPPLPIVGLPIAAAAIAALGSAFTDLTEARKGRGW